MKLQELTLTNKTKIAESAINSQFGDRLNFAKATKYQLKSALGKTQDLIREFKNSVRFHQSQQDPRYLKLIMVEQALTSRLDEMTQTNPVDQANLAQGVKKAAAAMGDASQAKNLQTAIDKTEKGQTLTSMEKGAMSKLTKGLSSTMQNPQQAQQLQQVLKRAGVKESKIFENEVQQAQVVLAAQDMVDRMQKMLEDVTEMQYKDLPALIDSIRGELGMDQAQSFNASATQTLTTLVTGLQSGKQEMDNAVLALTGQQPTTDFVNNDDIESPDMPEPDIEPEPEELPEPDMDLEPDLGRKRR